jgi:undecaprenyl-diphosphatase
MPLDHVAILAIVQGITEFLPISSSAHLALLPWLMGWEDQGLAFDVALHFGTLLAILLYFFRDWVQIFAQGFGIDYPRNPVLAQNPRLLWYLAAGSVPVAIAGLMFKEIVETTLRNPLIIGGMIIGVGLLMGWADRTSSLKKDLNQLSLQDALIIGLAQAIAIVPGTSRSGITIIAALFRGVERAAAARFSFLLATPAMFGATLKSVYDALQEGVFEQGTYVPMLLGILISGIVGWLVIAFFIRFLRQHSLYFFVVYRVIFGIIIVALATFFRFTAE